MLTPTRPPGRRTRRRLWALVVAALAATAAPADARPALVTKTFVLKRTTSGPSTYQLHASIYNDSRGSFIGAVGARVENGAIVATTASWAGSAGRWKDETLGVSGTRFTACDVGVCHGDAEGWHGLASTYFDDGIEDEGALTHVLVVLTGKEVEHSFSGQGWTLRPARLAYRYLDGGETSPASSHVNAYGAEVYLDGSLPGGRHGSLAVGVPPCSFSMTGTVPRGVGTVTLDGGVTSESYTCPVPHQLLSSWATRATTWRLHGMAAGDSNGMDTRLFVVDLPARLP